MTVEHREEPIVDVATVVTASQPGYAECAPAPSGSKMPGGGTFGFLLASVLSNATVQPEAIDPPVLAGSCPLPRECASLGPCNDTTRPAEPAVDAGLAAWGLPLAPFVTPAPAVDTDLPTAGAPDPRAEGHPGTPVGEDAHASTRLAAGPADADLNAADLNAADTLATSPSVPDWASPAAARPADTAVLRLQEARETTPAGTGSADNPRTERQPSPLAALWTQADLPVRPQRPGDTRRSEDRAAPAALAMAAPPAASELSAANTPQVFGPAAPAAPPSADVLSSRPTQPAGLGHPPPAGPPPVFSETADQPVPTGGHASSPGPAEVPAPIRALRPLVDAASVQTPPAVLSGRAVQDGMVRAANRDASGVTEHAASGQPAPNLVVPDADPVSQPATQGRAPGSRDDRAFQAYLRSADNAEAQSAPFRPNRSASPTAVRDDAPGPEVAAGRRTAAAMPAPHVVPDPGSARSLPLTVPTDPGTTLQPPPTLAEPSVDGEPLGRAIVKSLQVQWRRDGGEARLKLHPEFLGDLTLSLRIQGSSVTAVLVADSAAVREWIETHQADLRRALNDAGLSLDRLEVDADGHAGERRDQADHDRRRPAARQKPEPGRFEALL